MKKSHFIFLLCLLVCILCCGCSENEECSHQYATTLVKEATCGQSGSLKHTCSLCGFSVPQTLPALSHSFTEAITKEATCSEGGTITRTCEFCAATEETYTEPVPHVFNLYSLTPNCCTVCQQIVENAAADPNGQWYGKNWVALGTSLTSEEQGTFVKPLAGRTGLQVTNLGIPGGTATGEILKTAKTADLSEADLITIEFGVNDWAENCPLGHVGDTVPYLSESHSWDNGGNEDGTFAGACYQIFTALQKQAPQAVIIFLTEPTGCKDPENSGNCSREARNYYELRQWDYTETAMAVARYTGIRVIDAGSMSMINQEHSQYLADHIHHSALGGEQYALTVWAELKDIATLLKSE